MDVRRALDQSFAGKRALLAVQFGQALGGADVGPSAVVVLTGYSACGYGCLQNRRQLESWWRGIDT